MTFGENTISDIVENGRRTAAVGRTRADKTKGKLPSGRPGRRSENACGSRGRRERHWPRTGGGLAARRDAEAYRTRTPTITLRPGLLTPFKTVKLSIEFANGVQNGRFARNESLLIIF